ncbi:FxsA family protein [Sulfurospirillum sp. 1612]|uniref:FxsA family protein n=1 Tax=Sulfurospirillum sp. 1612 TaxID=3094835 RepID=UPI002F94664C
MIYFFIYLFLEVTISVNIASQIGAFATFSEIVISAILGFGLLANFRYTFFETMQALNNRTISIEEFQKLNAFSVIGALLLILPGFFSDILGILLQFSFFATIFARKILHINNKTEKFKDRRDDEVIDVEIIDDHTTK